MRLFLLSKVLNMKDGTIIKEFQKAYFLKERLLRAAIVSVSKPVSNDKETKAEEEIKLKTLIG